MATRTFSDAGGNWSNNAAWVEGSPPDATMDVVATATSGVVTVNTTTAVCKTLDLTGLTNAMVLGTNQKLTVSGSVTLITSMLTANSGSTLAIDATGTLISAGNTLYNLATSVGTITLGDNTTVAHYLSIYSGTLSLGDTLNVGDKIEKSGGTFTHNNYGVVMTGASPIIVAIGIVFYDLTYNGTSVKTNSLTIYRDLTVEHTLTIAGDLPTNRLLVKTDTLGTPITLTVTGANLTGTTNVDFMDITFADNKVGDTDLTNGGANSIGDAGGNTRTLGTGNLVMTTAVKQYWQNVAGGSWSTAGNWTSRVPLPQDDVDLGNTADATPITYNSGVTVTADMPRLGKSISWTGALHAGTKPTLLMITSGRNTIFGSFTLITDMTFTFNQYITFQGRGSNTLTSAGKGFDSNTTFSPVNGTLTLLDSFSSKSSTYFTNGTFDANGYNVTVYSWGASTGATTNLGSGTWTMTGSAGGWSGASVVASTSTIAITGTGVTYFNGGTGVFNNITIAPSAGVTTFSGAFTFANMTMSSAGTKTVKFTKTTTYTMTGTDFLEGTSGNLITLDTNDGTGQFTLTKASGTVETDYLNLSNSNATVATWYAGANSVDTSNNDGWIFTGLPSGVIPLRTLLGVGT